MKKIITLISLALLLFLIPGCIYKSTYSGTQESNHITEIESGSVNIITKNTTVKANETMLIRNGSTLEICDGATLTVKGELMCEEGSSVTVSGKITTKSGSEMSVGGRMVIEGSVELGGMLTVEETGTISGGGSLAVLNSFEDIYCMGSVTAKITAPAPVTVDGVTTVGGILVVNKKYSLPQDYGSELSGAAYAAWYKMKTESGYEMTILSGYRSYEKQEELFEYWCNVDGYELACMESALPGCSEHQSGLAMDIGKLETEYAYSDEGKWLAEHCHEFGFIIRYPEDKTNITGYMYEPWHIRYLGKSTAKLVHDSGLTLEEFLGIEG